MFMHKIIALIRVQKAQVFRKKVHGINSHTHIHMNSHTCTHEIIDDGIQAHCLAKVFNSPNIKYLNKVLILVNKSGVLHGRCTNIYFVSK
jgi:hypothetical protein